MELTYKEKCLIAKLLTLASDRLEPHRCNDLPDDIYAGFTHEEKHLLYKEWMGDERFSDDAKENEELVITDDWVLMECMASKVLNTLKN